MVLPHLNHIKVLDIAENEKVVMQEEDIRWTGLPFLNGYINQNKDIILGGFDKKVAKFTKKGTFCSIQATDTPSIAICKRMRRAA